MTEFAVSSLVGLILIAYGWIFKTIVERIKRNEDSCSDLKIRIESEMRELRENNSIVFIELQARLAGIETNIEWIKETLRKGSLNK